MAVLDKILVLLFGIIFIKAPVNLCDEIVDTRIYEDTEYFYARRARDYYRATEFCNENGGHVVKIDSMNTHTFIVEWLNETGNREHMMLGMDKLRKKEYRWSVDGERVAFHQWAEEPSEDDHCAVQEAGLEGLWHSMHCNWMLRVIMCQRIVNHTDPIVPEEPPPPEGNCPPGYFALEGEDKCFQVNTRNIGQAVTWHEAREICKEGPGDFSDLASFHKIEEIALLASTVEERALGLWIGLKSGQEYAMGGGYKWYWADNSVYQYKYWYEDPFLLNKEICAELRLETEITGSWYEMECDTGRGFICESYKSAEYPEPPPDPPSNCREGYEAHHNGCYRVIMDPKNWEAAKEACEEDGAFLVTSHSTHENAFIQLKALSIGTSVWLGFRDSGQGYEWVDQWYPLYINWASGQPPSSNRGCVYLISADGNWKNDICSRERFFICKTTTDSPVTLPPIGSGKCPPTLPNQEPWVDHGDFCYYPFIEGTVGAFWLDALNNCMKLDRRASLVSIHDPVTRKYLEELVKGGPLVRSQKKFWIGMHRSAADPHSFYWADGSSVQFTNWEVHHPDPERLDHECVYMHVNPDGQIVSGTWQEEGCNFETLPYVCSVRKYEKATPPPPTPGECPEGWDAYGDVCHLISPNEMTSWDRAIGICKELGGFKATLASVEDFNVNEVLIDALHNRSRFDFHRGYWIGFKARLGDEFRWADNSYMIYQNWESSDQPILKEHTHTCAEVDSETGFWRMASCQAQRGFTCSVSKAEAGLPDPNQPPVKGPGGTGGLALGAIVGVTFSVVIAVAAVGSAGLFLVLRNKRKNDDLTDKLTKNSQVDRVAFDNVSQSVDASMWSGPCDEHPPN